MNQINDVVLSMLQTSVEYQANTVRTERGEETGGSDFRKLMEQKRGQEKPETEMSQTESGTVEDSQAADAQTEEAPDTVLAQELAQAQMLWMETGAVKIQQAPVTPETAPVAAVNQAAAQPVADAAQVQTVQADSAAVQPAAEGTQQAQTGEQARNIVTGQTEAQPMETRQAVQTDAPAPKTADVEVKTTEDGAVEAADVEAPVFRKVESTPIKVGEATVTEKPAEAKSVETQVSEKLTEALRNGQTRTELLLEPEHLGKVTVELTWSKDGSLRVALHAENSQTRSLLEKDVAGLQALLSRNAQQEVQVEVPRQQESQRQDLYDDQQRQNQQQQRRQDERRQNGGQDFLHQLRLGLIPLEEDAS